MSASGTPLADIWTLANIISFFSGTQLIALGVVCEYFARMYYEIKNRPIFITKEESPEDKTEK